jgi:hypothetical protein
LTGKTGKGRGREGGRKIMARNLYDKCIILYFPTSLKISDSWQYTVF